MDGNCAEASASVHGKMEVFECNYGDYAIRYSRWDERYDTFDYFDSHLTDATPADWSRQRRLPRPDVDLDTI